MADAAEAHRDMMKRAGASGMWIVRPGFAEESA
jgi:hypothetical protein